jgi:cytochrome c-type biogenesis protein CcmH
MILTMLLSLTISQEPEYAPTRLGTTPLESQKEAVVQAIGKKIRCVACQGVAIADSPAAVARAQLDKVRELVAQGKNEEEILSYFESRFGEFILMEPKKSGVTLGVWVFPILLLLGGTGVILWSSRKRISSPATEPKSAAEPPLAGATDEALLNQVRQEISK